MSLILEDPLTAKQGDTKDVCITFKHSFTETQESDDNTFEKLGVIVDRVIAHLPFKIEGVEQ